MKIILVTVDCLRADAVDTMPNLKKMGEKYHFFNKVYSNATYTVASVKSFLTSTLPMEGGDFSNFSLPTFPSSLSSHGIPTACFHSNPWLTYYDSYKAGFDVFEDVVQAGSPIGDHEAVFGRMSKWIDGKDNFFAWAHLMDAHDIMLGGKEDLPNYAKRYYGGLKKIDSGISRYFDLADLVIVTADHGEELGEYGNYGHHSHYDNVSQELIRIPFIVKANRRIIPGKDDLMSLFCLGPSIIDFAGIDDFCEKKSIFDDRFGEDIVAIEKPVFYERGLTPEMKHVYEFYRVFITNNQKITTLSTVNGGQLIEAILEEL